MLPEEPRLPGETAFRAERAAFLTTVSTLPPQQFESGPTLCEGWAPRDVLGHLLGIDRRPLDYVRALGRIGAANAAIVAHYRKLNRAELLTEAAQWAKRPAPLSRVAAYLLLGDLGIHHQDVLRPAGLPHAAPPAVARAVLREGVTLGGRRLLTHRVVPTDGLARPMGRGREVRGDTVTLGLWLAGRRGLDPLLDMA